MQKIALISRPPLALILAPHAPKGSATEETAGRIEQLRWKGLTLHLKKEGLEGRLLSLHRPGRVGRG